MTAALAGTMILFWSHASLAFDPDFNRLEDPTLIERFPSGSLVTREKADFALQEVSRAKKNLKELSDYSERRCQENFLVNNCIDSVRKAKFRQQKRLSAIETEARTYIRQDNTRLEAERQAKRDQKAATPPKKAAKREGKNPNSARKSAQATRDHHEKRVQQVEHRKQRHAAQQGLEAQNQAKYQKKLQQREEKRLKREQKLKARQEKKRQQQSKNARNK